jgi:hypothetical protein
LGELGDVLGGRDGVGLEMHLEAEIKLDSEMHLGAVIERVWGYIWSQRSRNSEMHVAAMIERV